MRKILLACAALAALFVTTNTASADEFYGGWKYDGNMLILGDSTDSTGLKLFYSPRYCGRPATVSTNELFRMLAHSKRIDGGYVNWRIDRICNDGYTRVCVTTSLGHRGCNTFRDAGWVNFNN